jgi:predicted RNase H-like HicB family nuclease
VDIVQAYEAHHYSIAVLDPIETTNSRMDQTVLRYPIAIEPGNVQTTWGVVVPDLPGCFSAADGGVDEAIDNAKESIELWIKVASDAGQDIPKPSSILALQKKNEFEGWLWTIIEINRDYVCTPSDH